jgi:hypothetical protein
VVAQNVAAQGASAAKLTPALVSGDPSERKVYCRPALGCPSREHMRPLTTLVVQIIEGCNMSEGHDKYLTVSGAWEVLRKLGFDVSFDQVRSWATTRKLPFFKFSKQLFISESELVNAFRKMQFDAIRDGRIRRGIRR